MKEDPRYQKYIKSPQWRAKCDVYWAKYGRSCKACGKTEGLHLHHMTYDRLTREPMIDLLGLCYSCHALVHRTHRQTGYRDLRLATMLVVRLKQQTRLSRRKA